MPEQRKKLKRYEEPNHARFLTFSCYRRVRLFDDDAAKDTFAEQLDLTRARTHFRLIAWVVMPEHVHLLIVPDLPESPASKVLWHLKRGVAQSAIQHWNNRSDLVLKRITPLDGKPRFWQRGGGYDRNIYSNDELIEKIGYIHNNPVRRGLVEMPTEWKWSSARWYVGMESVLEIDSVSESGV
ncbi:MAG: REP-associated tyrosine transposase [Planctomycetota bacterium]